MATTITGTTIDVGPNKLVSDSSGNVTASGVLSDPSGNVRAGRKNLVLNGSMQVSQRGTSSTSNGYVSLDRYYINQSGGSTTFSQETFAAGSEIEQMSKYATLAVSSGNDNCAMYHKIEDVTSVPTGVVTLSFYAKGTNPDGNLTVSAWQNFGSGGSSEVSTTPQTVTLTSSWQRFTVNITVPSVTGKTVGAGSHFYFGLGQGSSSSTNAWELNITGFQLELGSVATDFEHRSFGETLADCQRYYCSSYKVGQYAGGNHADTCIREVSNGYNYQNIGNFNFPVQMRAAPTVIIYNPITGTVNSFRGDGSNYSNAVSHPSTNTGCNFYTNGVAVNQTVFISIHATFNAEL